MAISQKKLGTAVQPIVTQLLTLSWSTEEQLFATCDLEYTPRDYLQDYFEAEFSEKVTSGGITSLVYDAVFYAQLWSNASGCTTEVSDYSFEAYQTDSIQFSLTLTWYSAAGNLLGSETLTGKAQTGKNGAVGYCRFDDLQGSEFVAYGWEHFAA